MKAIMVMFDSLNRHMLPPYGCDWIKAPNFQRLSDQSLTFDNCYIGSMPCMPARREIHTGRYNFLHRSWGPLEPFDDSMPEILRENGVYSHLVTDHQHYWEDGAGTYHNRYSTYEFVRGQEGDFWKGHVNLPEDTPKSNRRTALKQPRGRWFEQDWINRKYLSAPEDKPQAKTFKLGMEFIRENRDADNWFLQIETFDPHEPFFSDQKYKDLYPRSYDGPHFDWVPYDRVTESPEQVEHIRMEYAALVSMCDDYLGRLLDQMDALELWKDTMLIVCADHGFLLGEHDWWAKMRQPWYNYLANTPLFVWDPRYGKGGKRRKSLVQFIDLPATLLEYFGLERPADMEGKPLKETIASDLPVRERALFGLFGGHVNMTDGRYVYMRSPIDKKNEPLYEYTLMPTHMRNRFTPEELQDIELADPFPFTKGCRTMKIKARPWMNPHDFGTLLYDVESDPGQKNPLKDPVIEQRMIEHMIGLMRENDAPEEQYERLGFI